ncbi:kinase domain protein, putative (macronuclear) [Tetrahymena thermophila SB210]|uniref:Kinase domain protein, putative n=1 Tax=Tetrahymena thermophila (strain SB210) TaxID=312017 RepID=I7MDI8_TETTS|nr:kinase domain protein, putative [Tetrahymena thermophila SB210]EAR87689.2 kinase domain protein, putative [Tetrahymena thermophila SB210]|eukprot:XP_001007934.2 kinase domain protein, putative [Tetrahymena thermophila SB210]
MADVREQRIYCAEQIVVPQELPIILKHYSKEVIRNNPVSIYDFSAKYFRDLIEKRKNNSDKHIMNELEKPDSSSRV